MSEWKKVGYLGHVKDNKESKILIVKIGETRYSINKSDFEKFVKGEKEWADIFSFPEKPR